MSGGVFAQATRQMEHDAELADMMAQRDTANVAARIHEETAVGVVAERDDVLAQLDTLHNTHTQCVREMDIVVGRQREAINVVKVYNVRVNKACWCAERQRYADAGGTESGRRDAWTASISARDHQKYAR